MELVKQLKLKRENKKRISQGGNLLTGKGKIRAGEGTIKVGQDF